MQVFLTTDHLAIVTDFADGGELATQITARMRQSPQPNMAYPEPEARRLFQQLVMAVDFCHRCATRASVCMLSEVALRQQQSSARASHCDVHTRPRSGLYGAGPRTGSPCQLQPSDS